MNIKQYLDDNVKLKETLNTIGLIAAPTSIVAIICQLPLLDLNTKQTALILLLTLLVTILLLFKKIINKTISSTSVIVVLIAFLTVYFVYYKNIIFKDTGLVKFYKEAKEADGDLLLELNDAHKDLNFLATNFYRTPKDYQKTYLDKLSHGLRIRILFFNPYSNLMGEAAKDFGQEESELRAECETGLENIKILMLKWNKKKNSVPNSRRGDIQVRFYNQLPRFRAYFIDTDEEDKKSFIIPYLYKANSPDVPGFKFLNTKNGVFNIYFKNYDALWDKSIEIDKLVPSNSKINN